MDAEVADMQQLANALNYIV